MLTFFRREPEVDFEATEQRLGGVTIVKGYYQPSRSRTWPGWKSISKKI